MALGADRRRHQPDPARRFHTSGDRTGAGASAGHRRGAPDRGTAVWRVVLGSARPGDGRGLACGLRAHRGARTSRPRGVDLPHAGAPHRIGQLRCSAGLQACPTLIRRRWLRAHHDEHVHRTLRRIELEPELLLDGRENRWAVGINCWDVARLLSHPRRRLVWSPLERRIERAASPVRSTTVRSSSPDSALATCARSRPTVNEPSPT